MSWVLEVYFSKVEVFSILVNLIFMEDAHWHFEVLKRYSIWPGHEQMPRKPQWVNIERVYYYSTSFCGKAAELCSKRSLHTLNGNFTKSPPHQLHPSTYILWHPSDKEMISMSLLLESGSARCYFNLKEHRANVICVTSKLTPKCPHSFCLFCWSPWDPSMKSDCLNFAILWAL